MVKAKNIQVQILHSKGSHLTEGSEHYLRCIYSDKGRFLQIMLNFLSNALKFTPEGGNVIIETIVKETQDIQKREKSKTKKDGDENESEQDESAQNSNTRKNKQLKNEFEMMTAKRCLTPRVRL